MIVCDFIWFHLISLDSTWFHLVSLEFTWFHLNSIAFTWFHLISTDFTWLHLISFGFIWFHLISLDWILFHLSSCDFTLVHLISLDFNWFHLISLWFHFISLELIRKHCTLRREKGKAPVGKGKRERVARTFEAKFHSTTRPRVRTHKRNETISQLDSPPQPPIERERERDLHLVYIRNVCHVP